MTSKRRRLLHVAFFTLLALGTLVALFYAEEDWRGARVWNAVKRDLKARGESVDRADFIPPPVPDDQNLAMAPLFVRFYRYKASPRNGQFTFDRNYSLNNETFTTINDMPWGEVHQEIPHPVLSKGWLTGHALALSLMQAYYLQRKEFPHPPQPGTPADDVLLALTHYQPVLDELAQAAAVRPLTRFPANWTLRPVWDISLPQYNIIQILTSTLRLRAVAELTASQPSAARRDLALMFRLRQTMENDPTMIAALADVACLNLLMQPIWEGLAARQWTAADLDALRDSLSRINIVREYQQALRGERVFFAASLPEDLQDAAQARELSKLMTDTQGGGRWLWKLLPYWPRGWYEQNAASASHHYQVDWIDAVDPANHRMNFARNQAAEQAMKDLPATPYTLLAQIAQPVFTSVSNKCVQTQAILDQAATACALEHYYLDHHAYPAALAALVPAYLDRMPSDIIDGAPLRYRLTVDGRYQLYSIGLDGHDDGGTIEWPSNRNWQRDAPPLPNGRAHTFPSPVRDKGDWVWQYAPAEPPDPPANTSRLDSLPSR